MYMQNTHQAALVRDMRIQAAIAAHIAKRNTVINVNARIPLYTTSNANETNLTEEYINAQKSVVVSAEKNTT